MESGSWEAVRRRMTRLSFRTSDYGSYGILDRSGVLDAPCIYIKQDTAARALIAVVSQ